MDICIPSNLERLLYLYNNSLDNIKNDNIYTFSIDDNETIETIKFVENEFNYILDPHTSVGYSVLKKIENDSISKLIISTADYKKFKNNCMDNILPDIIKKDNFDNLDNHIITNNIYNTMNKILQKRNIVFIGMPGSGKSYLGSLLSKKLNINFFDIDKIIENEFSDKLCNIVKKLGNNNFVVKESNTIENLIKFNYNERFILSPGGSIIYNQKIMNLLNDKCIIILLNCNFNEIKSKLNLLKIEEL